MESGTSCFMMNTTVRFSDFIVPRDASYIGSSTIRGKLVDNWKHARKGHFDIFSFSKQEKQLVNILKKDEDEVTFENYYFDEIIPRKPEDAVFVIPAICENLGERQPYST